MMTFVWVLAFIGAWSLGRAAMRLAFDMWDFIKKWDTLCNEWNASTIN